MSTDANESIFDLPKFRESHIYSFTDSKVQSPYYTSSIKISSNRKTIGIVDQFQGKQPLILNRKFVVEKKPIELKLVQTLILDSHIVDHLHKFLIQEMPSQDSNDLAISFLKHVSAEKCDYSPVFYLAENWAKSSFDQYLQTSARKLSSILKLHSMDEEKFIVEGVVDFKKEAVEYYFDLYKSKTFEECGVEWAKKVPAYNAFEYYCELADLSYICLIKMVLIHFINPEINQENIRSKHSEFYRFLATELNIVLARESVLALYYFSGLAGKLIGVQKNTPYNKAKRNLLSTAWDLLLLRIPELLLSPDDLPELNLSYVVTSEEKLFELGSMFNLERILFENSTAHGAPILSYNSEQFIGVLSENVINELNRQAFETTMSRLEVAKGISTLKLTWLKEDLECQLKNFCR